MISVVVPIRHGNSPETTLRTLGQQDCENFEVILSWDVAEGNANRARNKGAGMARGEFLLFSDDDIEWLPGSIEEMRSFLSKNPGAAWAYGSYEMGGDIYCQQVFAPAALRQVNYISTMSLIRRTAFPGFDESVRRLQDWDLWLTMLARGCVGAYCRRLLFKTKVKQGITHGGDVTWEQAVDAIRRKHNFRS